MLRAREIRPYGSTAKYANLDLGRDEGTGRGDVTASFARPTADGKYECFTFVPGTMHNRVSLLLRTGVEVAVMAPDGGWDKLTWADVEPYLAPAKGHGTAAIAAVGGVEEYNSGEKLETTPPKLIKGMEDFLQLPKREQLAAVKDENFPDDKLAEILECTDARLSEQAREAALKKAERLTGDRK